MLCQEAAAILQLHAQVVAVQNIRNMVPVTLDINSGSFPRWREQFLLALGKYSLQDHVLQDACPLPSPDWDRMDCLVRSWLYCTLSSNLLDLVMRRSDQGVTAHITWLAIESQFLSNKEARALRLDTKLRTVVQGTLSVTDYCKLLKTTADDLAALGEPVSDRSLVLNLIRGLNEQFESVGRHLRRGRPFPSFLEACDELLLEEMTMGPPASEPPTALLTSTGGGSNTSRLPHYQPPWPQQL
jgi:hypothetical protein